MKQRLREGRPKSGAGDVSHRYPFLFLLTLALCCCININTSTAQNTTDIPTSTATTTPAPPRVVVLDFTLVPLRTNRVQCGWYGVYWPTDTGYATIRYDIQTGSLSFPRLHWSIAERDQCGTPSIPASPVLFGLWGLADNNAGLVLNTTGGQCIQSLLNGIRNNANQDAIVSTCTIKPEYRQEFLLKAQQKLISFCIINKEQNTCILNGRQDTYIQDQCSTNNGGCDPLSTCTTAPNGTAICGSVPTQTPTITITTAPPTTQTPDIIFYSDFSGAGSVYGVTVNVTSGVPVYYRVDASTNAPCPSSTSSLFSNIFQNLPFVPKSVRVHIQNYEIKLYGWYNNNGDNICGPSFTPVNSNATSNNTGLFNLDGWIVAYTAYSGVWKISPTPVPTPAPTVDPCTADGVKPYIPGRIYQPRNAYECCSYQGYKWCAIYYTSTTPSEIQYGPWRRIAACANSDGTTTTTPPTTTTPTPPSTRPPPTTQAPSTDAPTDAPTPTPTTPVPVPVAPPTFNWTSVTERTWIHPFQSSISFVYNNPPHNIPLYVRVQGRSTLITQGTTSSSIQVSADVTLKGDQKYTNMIVEILRDDQDGTPIAADHIYTQVVTRSAISGIAIPETILNAMANGQDAHGSSQPCPASANTGAIVGGVVAAMTALIILTNIATHIITKRHQPKIQSKPVVENWNVAPVTTEGVVVVV